MVCIVTYSFLQIADNLLTVHCVLCSVSCCALLWCALCVCCGCVCSGCALWCAVCVVVCILTFGLSRNRYGKPCLVRYMYHAVCLYSTVRILCVIWSYAVQLYSNTMCCNGCAVSCEGMKQIEHACAQYPCAHNGPPRPTMAPRRHANCTAIAAQPRPTIARCRPAYQAAILCAWIAASAPDLPRTRTHTHAHMHALRARGHTRMGERARASDRRYPRAYATQI